MQRKVFGVQIPDLKGRLQMENKRFGIVRLFAQAQILPQGPGQGTWEGTCRVDFVPL